MKKTILSLLALTALLFAACKQTPNDNPTEDTPGVPVTKTETQADSDSSFTATTDDIWSYIGYDLSKYKNNKIKIDFSCEMKVTNNLDKDVNLMWQVNVNTSSYPVIAEYSFAPGTTDWVSVKSTDEQKKTECAISSGTQLYLSTYDTDKKATKVTIELRNVTYTVNYEDKSGSTKNWVSDDVPSLKEAFKDTFDTFGLAVNYYKELDDTDIQKGLAKHVNTITMGNEFKPQFLLAWWSDDGSSKPMTDFTASNGLTIKVPASLSFTTADTCLSICKENGYKMRGHVLTWHSQTPDGFFAENYKPEYNDTAKNTLKNPVSADVMTARHEWYIKTVLTHVTEWEQKNNNGEHIIWAWDVINETVADDASGSNWCRGSTSSTKNIPPAGAGNGVCGSRWYQIYKNTDFITNAFRFATAYAPEDVKLCYNDYNEYQSAKVTGILNLIDLVKNAGPAKVDGKDVTPRIDVMGMQSHVGTNYPSTADYENAIKKYLKMVDVHVTELDIGNASTSSSSVSSYKAFFKVLNKYGKKYSGEHKITNVTIWGINNENTWLSNSNYPLLFSNCVPTDSFYAVIDTTK